MTNKPTNIKDDQLIESIIFAFWCDFCTAIYRNRNDPFSVGQLSACLLEQFSGFLYEEPANIRIDQFVAEYLEPYSHLDLHNILRNSLDHRLVEKLGPVINGLPRRLPKN